MSKLILVSLILVTVILPMQAARDRSAARGLRKTVLGITAYVAFYVIALVYVVPRFL